MQNEAPKDPRKHIEVVDLDAPDDTIAYWLSRPASERLDAVERLREMFYGREDAWPRLQRVLEVVERE